eukprot:1128963-Pelagomonas_calceolata.AAC.3
MHGCVYMCTISNLARSLVLLGASRAEHPLCLVGTDVSLVFYTLFFCTSVACILPVSRVYCLSLVCLHLCCLSVRHRHPRTNCGIFPTLLHASLVQTPGHPQSQGTLPVRTSTREERRGSWKSGRGMGGCADIGMGSRPAEAWQEVVVAVGGKPAPVIIIAPPPLRRLIARLGPAERAAATLWHPASSHFGA